VVIGLPWREWSISIRLGCALRQRRTKEDPPERVDAFSFPWTDTSRASGQFFL
jgi:hypothetical protein